MKKWYAYNGKSTLETAFLWGVFQLICWGRFSKMDVLTGDFWQRGFVQDMVFRFVDFRKKNALLPTTLNKIIPLEIRSPLSLAILCSAWVHKCMGAQKRERESALVCLWPYSKRGDLILCYGWYFVLVAKWKCEELTVCQMGSSLSILVFIFTYK